MVNMQTVLESIFEQREGIDYFVGDDEIRARCPVHRGSGRNFVFFVNTGFAKCFSHDCFRPHNVWGVLKNGVNEEFANNYVKEHKELITHYQSTDKTVVDDEYKLKGYIKNYNHDYLRSRGVSRSTAKLFQCGTTRDIFGNEQLVLPNYAPDGKFLGFSKRYTLDLPGRDIRYVHEFESTQSWYGLKQCLKNPPKHYVLVEGQIDVLKGFELGPPFVISPLGSSISKQQSQILKELEPDVIMPVIEPDVGGKNFLRAVYKHFKGFIHIEPIHLPIGFKDLAEMEDEESWFECWDFIHEQMGGLI